jgi:hypothetical protein
VVSSIRRVTDIMGEISAASNEQSLGVSKVGEAVTQMDQATQQNAALVEQMAAAASSLKSQAQELVQTVAVFKLAQGHQTATPLRAAPAAPRTQPSALARAPKRPSLAAVRKPALAGKPISLAAPTKPASPSASAKADAGDEWETF